MHVDVESYAVHSVSSGEDAQGQASLSTRHHGEELTASATSTDILEASALAWLALAQRIARRPGPAVAPTRDIAASEARA
jgi:2-isopropylmalate synthase